MTRSTINGTQPDHWQVTALEIAVLRALRHAGNWLIGKAGRGVHKRLGGIELFQIHTQLQVPANRLDDIMAGALLEFRAAVPDAPCLHELVEDYVRALLRTGQPHQRSYLEAALAHTDCDAA